MIDFATLQGLTIPEGVVTQIAKDGVVLWALENDKPIILEVEKITSDTYAGETTYTAEEFILLDIYPKTNGTVTVTYGGLTKTITDTSGAEEPNAQQVFFGTFNGVSDSVSTPSSGTLTIEGDYRGVGVGFYAKSSKSSYNSCGCVTAIIDFANMFSIPSSAFYSNALLTSVTIPNSVKSIGDYAFFNCSGLTNVLVSEKVESIGKSAFSACTNLTDLTLNGVKSIGDTAFQSTGLTGDLILPKTLTTIGNQAFLLCSGITSVQIPDSIISIGYNPWGECSENNFISVDNGNEAFYIEGNCLIEKATKRLVSGFNNSVIPSDIKIIGGASFRSCTMESIDIPSGVTSIEKIAFSGCTGPTSITIPASVTNIGDNAFYNITGLTSVIVLATTPPVASNAIFGTGTTSSPLLLETITVPKGCGDTYKTADSWSTYADLIVEAS